MAASIQRVGKPRENHDINIRISLLLGRSEMVGTDLHSWIRAALNSCANFMMGVRLERIR